MTIQELQQLYYLENLITIEENRLEDLRAAAGIKSPVLSDMPKAPGARDKLGDLVPQIVDQEREIMSCIRQYTEAREKLLRYINHVPNARIKLIMILRFVDHRGWEEIADVIGGKETGDSARMAINRYLEMEQSYAGG